MKQRGRKSAASLEVVQPNNVHAIQRPEPNTELTPAQSIEWVAVVNGMPAEWFPRETHALLTQYCRHVVSARRIGELIEGLINGDTESDNWIADYDQLLRMQEREGRAMSSLATRMRISQHSQWQNTKSKTKTKGKPLHLS